MFGMELHSRRKRNQSLVAEAANIGEENARNESKESEFAYENEDGGSGTSNPSVSLEEEEGTSNSGKFGDGETGSKNGHLIYYYGILVILVPIPRRTRAKRLLSCRKRLTFDDKCSTPKRKRIPFDVNGTKVAKKLKKIKLEDEFEGSDESKVNSSGGRFNHRKSTEDSQCTARSGVKDKLKVTIKRLPSLHKEVGSSSKQKRNSDGNEKDVLSLWNRRDGRLVQEEKFLNKALDLEPQTPLPAKQKHPSSRKFSAGDKINQLKCGTEDNLQLVVEISSEAWYYTRFVNKCVLDLIRSLECQGASNQPCNRATEHQSLSDKLKVHGVQESLKGQKKRSKKQSRRSGYAKDTLRDWRRLLKKSVAEQPSAKLDEAKGLSLEERALLFVDKVGRIQGSRKQVPWKGSVLDSVIGAFLTQKVSDNFSSSAFMLLGASFPQHHSCDEYGRHHRMLREKRSNARSSPQKPAFGCICKFLDTQGNGWNLEKHTRIPDDGKREKTPRQFKVSRRANPIPDWSSLRMKYSGEGERERRSIDTMDYADWVAVSRANVADISKAISLRGMNHKLAKRIKAWTPNYMILFMNTFGHACANLTRKR
ncbi:hypothetical protein Cgig2_013602 [Carnegiea gigantea]|uniref:Uncharacterized protein n=1 Tax=Carnegiea gigantea TaxID=171969 RepID=A0A9Q1QFH5_9CARY|nr:hypothetical protein Cgig2_013602 [Carnegiea gigantea]